MLTLTWTVNPATLHGTNEWHGYGTNEWHGYGTNEWHGYGTSNDTSLGSPYKLAQVNYLFTSPLHQAKRVT